MLICVVVCLCFCLNHDFNKIYVINRINTFSTETQRTPSCTDNQIKRLPLAAFLSDCLNYDFIL